VSKIKFGTDGWRAIISDDFTFENVKIVAQAMADFIKSQRRLLASRKSEIYGRKFKIAVGYDTRFMSEKYAELIACVMAGNGIAATLSDRPTPTPSVSYTIVRNKLIGGIMVTASHNPSSYNGIKYKGYFGGSVGKEVTDVMEFRLYKSPVRFMGRDEAVRKGLLEYRDIVAPHVKAISKFVDMKLLKKARLNVLVDSMGGTGGLYVQELLKGTKIKVTTINSKRDAYFGNRSPEPNDVHLRSTSDYMKGKRFDVCIATDGDADRLGVIAGNGDILSGHKVMTLLLLHLLEGRGLKGGVVQTICGTGLIDKIAAAYDLKTYATPVGFKYICDIFIKENIVMGGEETGGVAFKGWLPERDGILSGLLILELLAHRKRPLTGIIKAIHARYGTFIYKRYDMRLPQDKKKKLLAKLAASSFASILGKKVTDVQSYDGFKYVLSDGSWVMLRPSGTEPKLRVYSEAHSEKDALRLIGFGKKFAASV